MPLLFRVSHRCPPSEENDEKQTVLDGDFRSDGNRGYRVFMERLHLWTALGDRQAPMDIVPDALHGSIAVHDTLRSCRTAGRHGVIGFELVDGTGLHGDMRGIR